jgi:hypothetical protein
LLAPGGPDSTSLIPSPSFSSPFSLYKKRAAAVFYLNNESGEDGQREDINSTSHAHFFSSPLSLYKEDPPRFAFKQ